MPNPPSSVFIQSHPHQRQCSTFQLLFYLKLKNMDKHGNKTWEVQCRGLHTLKRFHRWILYVFFVSVWVFSEFSISSQLPKTCHYGWIGHFKLPFGLNVCVNVCWKTVCAQCPTMYWCPIQGASLPCCIPVYPGQALVLV